jgi:hypothetical protein
MIEGVIHFTPNYAFDERDLRMAQLVYPGRTVALSPDGHLEVRPAPPPADPSVEIVPEKPGV